MLFSGMDSHLAGLGAMNGFAGSNQQGLPGYEGHLNSRTVSLAQLLNDAGYATFMAGKWHLGDTPDSLPAAQGFDRYFIQVHGTPPGGHFNLNGREPGSKGAYYEDGEDRTGTAVTPDFFSSNFYTDKLIEYLESGKESTAPFFAYLAFSAPHIPVQAPDSHIDLYRGRYDDGYDVLRQARLDSLRRMGLVEPDAVVGRVAPNVQPWEQLGEQEKRRSARRMEVYAAAIDNLDDNVGRVLDYLQASGRLDDTLVIFMSDNGAAGFDGWQSEAGIRRFNAADNSIENLGRDGSMMFYGPGWASAGSAPFYLFKRHMSEGGIRVPFIVSGPDVKQRGSVSRELLTVRDVAPTLLEIAGARYPDATYDGREILPQTGASFAAQLAGDRSRVHASHQVFGWELFGRQGVRKGDWKALRIEPPFGSGHWQLFNLKTDPGESRDLAMKRPQILADMTAAWDQYARENNVIVSDGPLVFP